MTMTVTLAHEVRLVVASVLIGVAFAYASVIGWIMAREPDVPPLPVWPDHRAPIGPVRPGPWDDVVTHNELDQFARHYQGLSR